MGERFAGSEEVSGSNPLGSTISLFLLVFISANIQFMRLLLTTAIMMTLIAPAYAGSGDKNSYEDGAYLDDLRQIEEPITRPAVQQSQLNAPSSSSIYKTPPEQSASSDNLS